MIGLLPANLSTALFKFALEQFAEYRAARAVPPVWGAFWSPSSTFGFVAELSAPMPGVQFSPPGHLFNLKDPPTT
jgi:hypothetical protein